MTLATLNTIALAVGLDADWTLGRPPWITPDAYAIDQQLARESVCGTCGRHGLEPVAFHKARAPRPQYRCFARCPDCGSVEEY